MEQKKYLDLNGLRQFLNRILNLFSPKDHTHSNYASQINIQGNGNAITELTQSGNTISAKKNDTFLTSHPDIATKTDTVSNVNVSSGTSFTVIDSVDKDLYGHITAMNTKTVTLPQETSLSKEINATEKKTLSYGDTFNAVIDTDVDGHKITYTRTTFTLPTVDADINGTSTNPVQNRAIYATIENNISSHDTSQNAHNDIRTSISDLSNQKIDTSDIADDLVSAVSSKVLSANQGVELNKQISQLRSVVSSKAAQSEFDLHVGNLSNPHGITLEHLGVQAVADELNLLQGVSDVILDASNYSNYALPLEGGSLTGLLVVKNNATWPAIGFDPQPSDKSFRTYFAYDAPENSSISRFRFQERSRTSTGDPLDYLETYSLPNADSNLSANASYEILTTKNPIRVDQGGTGALTVADARKNLKAVCKTGDTITGVLQLGAETGNTSAYYVQINRHVNDTDYSARTYVDNATGGACVSMMVPVNGSLTIKNRMRLDIDSTEFMKPVSVGSGGTGATSAAEARVNLGIRSGTELPESANEGDLFVLHS